MTLTVNGETKDIPDGTTVSAYLKENKIRPEIVAVELNCEILDKAQYDTTELHSGDILEVVMFMGGG